MAQERILSKYSVYAPIRGFASNKMILNSNLGFMDYLKDSKLIKVNTSNPYFQRTYLIDKGGETLSSGYMPSAFFSPNDNLIVITGMNRSSADSFNPYRASDLTSAIFFGTLNNFISKMKIKKR